MLGTPSQTKLTFLTRLLTFLRVLLQRKLDYDTYMYAQQDHTLYTLHTFPYKRDRLLYRLVRTRAGELLVSKSVIFSLAKLTESISTYMHVATCLPKYFEAYM